MSPWELEHTPVKAMGAAVAGCCPARLSPNATPHTPLENEMPGPSFQVHVVGNIFLTAVMNELED